MLEDNLHKTLPLHETRMVFQKTTHDISVSVEPIFLDDQSDPSTNHYVWAYHVIIENHSDITVQLNSRYWNIMDGKGVIQEVEGEGVVGEQPVIEPGDSYEYTSGTPLQTSCGIMKGTYFMSTIEGDDLSIEIPAFSLDSPYQSNVIH